jgi:hypothetical protein
MRYARDFISSIREYASSHVVAAVDGGASDSKVFGGFVTKSRNLNPFYRTRNNCSTRYLGFSAALG